MKKTRPFRGLAAVLFSLAALSCGAAVMTPAYNFPGKHKNQSAQGFAIHGNSAFLFNNTGLCRIYDLKTRQLVADLVLDSTAPENHANCADFGVEFPEGNSEYPALYVSECYGERRCFVESITAKGSKLIQTLRVKTGGWEDYSFDWYIDREKKHIYTLSFNKEVNLIGAKTKMREYLVTKLPLPPLSAGDVVFTQKDILEQFTISFPQLSQGGTIRGAYLYLPVGHKKPNPDAKKKKTDKRDRALLVVNLRTKQIEKTIDLNDSLELEPEDASFHSNRLLMFCGQEGGLFDMGEFKK